MPVTAPLHDYEERAIDQALRLGSCPVLMPKGSGKTRTSLEIALRWEASTILILCPRTALTHWRRQILQWTDIEEDEIALVRGTPKQREEMWGNRQRYRILLTTYGVLLRDFARMGTQRWDVLIADEAHRVRNRKTQAFKRLKGLRYDHGLFLSGGIFRSRLLDVWTLLHLSNKRKFSSYWQFADTFIYIIEGPYGKELGGPRNLEGFRRLLKQYTVYVRPDELKGKLPERQRHLLEVELEGKQKTLYGTIWKDLIARLPGGGLMISQNEMTQIVRARQCLICPKLLDDSLGVGVGFETIVEHGEEDPHYIVFTPYTKAIPHFRDYLISQGYSESKVFVIKGGMDPDEQQIVTDNFQRTRGILLCSLNVAESWEVLTTNTAYFLGYDFSPDINEQAEDRLRRVSSDFPFVNYYYVCHMNTYDQEVLHKLSIKTSHIHTVAT